MKFIEIMAKSWSEEERDYRKHFINPYSINFIRELKIYRSGCDLYVKDEWLHTENSVDEVYKIIQEAMNENKEELNVSKKTNKFNILDVS